MPAAFKHSREAHLTFNNLAQTLADQRRYPEAHAAAIRAVSLGGPLLAASRETLEQIGRRMGK